MKMNNQLKYVVAAFAAVAFMAAAYYYPAETFLSFTVGWLFFIPAAFVVYMVYGYLELMKERKHKIEVAIVPDEAMRALARREAELEREKEKLYKELVRR
jgi:hypothetical protein